MDTTKSCKGCGIIAEEATFYTYKNQCKDGLKTYRSNFCKACHALKMRLHRKNPETKYNERSKALRTSKKKKAIEYLGGKCLDCNGVFPDYIYDFHHLNPDQKEGNPGELLGRRWESAKLELDKCVLLCANCHRTRHFGGDSN